MPTLPETDVVAPETLCPKCARTLIDPHGLGWCQACGFCRSLGDVCVPADKPAARPSPGPALQPPAAPTPSFAWLAGLLVGVLVLAVATWAISHYAPLKPLHRATWTSLQIGLGVLLMFIGQCYGLIRVAPEEATLHAYDAVVPFRLYGLIFQRLPRLCSVLYFGAWGLTLIVAALLCVGGLEHWLTYLPKAR